MTRKQAIFAAIQALSEDEDNSEATRILQEISDELPLMTWTCDAITDSVEQFIHDNGRVPTATDFKKKGLPPHTEFPRRFGMTLKEWLDTYYPHEREKKKISISAEDTELFISEYKRLQPTSAADYNTRRSPAAKGWSTIAKSMQLHKWRDLLHALSLPVYSQSEKTLPQIKVHIIAGGDVEQSLIR